jgi:hypothetical protein
MRHLPDSERPSYVSDRLSAVSHVPMQFLMSIGIGAVMLTAISLADLAPPKEGAAGFVSAEHTSSVDLRSTSTCSFPMLSALQLGQTQL